ncbi:MAG TPA: hypothetical protein VHC69_21485 [Polyangiaceae bacterium]|nr:hypothetical protein [Polyangiaceae bacterium]
MGESKKTLLGRRTFLKATGFAALARACSSDGTRANRWSGDGGPDAGVDSAADASQKDAALVDASAEGGTLDAPFGVWRAMRDALRSSPDSLADRAAALVAAKDAQGLFTFVRDQIATLPPVTAATEKSRRWGALAALRGGAGTPRERADLLALLLQRAGFTTASVVAGDPDGDLLGNAAPNTVYLRTIDATFSPADPPASLSSWVAALTGTDTAPEPQLLDPSGSQAQALFDAIDPLLPSNVSANGGVLALFKVPLVALDDGGTTKYLNPLLPTATFGEPYATNIAPAPDADPLPTLQATLLFSRANDPEKQIELVTATYTVDQLVGRQLIVHAQPAGAIEDLITSPLSNVVAFVPTIAVAGVDLSAMDRGKLTSTGSWITQGGDVLDTDAKGNVSCNGLSLGKGGDDSSAKNVTTVQVTANASAFPQIELVVSALDKDEKPVAGLGAGAFSVSEDGSPVSFLLRDNGATGPRVLFLLDTTGSQPPIPSAWASAVASAIFDASPDATAQVVNLSTSSAAADGYGISDAAALADALAGTPIGGVQSNLYGAMLAAVDAAPTLVVLLSDGDAEDTDLKDRAMRALAGGAPVLAVTSAKMTPVADSPVMDAFAAASGGKSVDGGDLSDATETTSALSQIVMTRVTSPYRLSYTAEATGASKRTVTVTATAKGTTTYDVPAQPLASAAVAGLYLSLTLKSSTSPDETWTRVLGGFVPGSDQTVTGAIDAAIADARAAMLGSVLISFEGAAPSISAWLADAIEWRLSTEPSSTALQKGDVAGAFSALGDVPATIPREAPALHVAALPVPNAVIYEESLRAVMFCTRAGAPVYRADILPFTRLTTATSSNDLDVFRTNLLGSLRMAVAEGSAFQTSTVSELQGKDLAYVDRGMVAAGDVPQVPESQRTAFVNALNQYTDWYRFVAKDGSSLAFWAVHPHGSCLGILPNGSGGGEDPCASYRGLATMLDLLALFSDILGVPALSIWAELGKLVALAGVETILAFNYTPVMVTSDQQVGAIGCSFASGLLGAQSLSAHFKQVGVQTLATNYMQASMVNTVVGAFSVCSGSGNPCK